MKAREQMANLDPVPVASDDGKSAQQPAALSAVRTLETERDGLEMLRAALADGLSDPFARAVQTLQAARGRVIVTGVGDRKSVV